MLWPVTSLFVLETLNLFNLISYFHIPIQTVSFSLGQSESNDTCRFDPDALNKKKTDLVCWQFNIVRLNGQKSLFVYLVVFRLLIFFYKTLYKLLKKTFLSLHSFVVSQLFEFNNYTTSHYIQCSSTVHPLTQIL